MDDISPHFPPKVTSISHSPSNIIFVPRANHRSSQPIASRIACCPPTKPPPKDPIPVRCRRDAVRRIHIDRLDAETLFGFLFEIKRLRRSLLLWRRGETSSVRTFPGASIRLGDVDNPDQPPPTSYPQRYIPPNPSFPLSCHLTHLTPPPPPSPPSTHSSQSPRTSSHTDSSSRSSPAPPRRRTAPRSQSPC